METLDDIQIISKIKQYEQLSKKVVFCILLIFGSPVQSNSYKSGETFNTIENNTHYGEKIIKNHDIIEYFSKAGIYHPLISYYFAHDNTGKATIDGAKENFECYASIIKQHGPKLYLDSIGTNYSYSRGFLESKLNPGAIANAKSPRLNAAGLFQYIPETRLRQYNRAVKVYDKKIVNNRSDPVANSTIAKYHFEEAVMQCNGKQCFALRGHHAGMGRIVGYGKIYPGYLPLFTAVTGQEPSSMLDRYNSILPRALVNDFMSLKDNSFIYVAQILAAQTIVNLIETDPEQINVYREQFKTLQKTKSRGVAIDDVLYPQQKEIIDSIPPTDSILLTLINHFETIIKTSVKTIDPNPHRKTRQDNGIAISSLLQGKGVKILVPFTNSDNLRQDKTVQGLRYKQLMYLIELARIHGLISFTREKLPTKEYVFHLGLMPRVTQEDIEQFKKIKNWNSN